MKKSDLKILIKKIQNECALEEPTHITYYWNEDHKLVFKLFFDSLIIPEELMVDEDNISKCFSEQNVYEFEDDFVIKELNREKGYIEVIPDDQKFKVINSYKDYNEDEKDVKNESIVHLAGERISETFAKTKGFILKESENTAVAGSVNMIAIAFTMYALNDNNKQYLFNVIQGIGTMMKALEIPKKYAIKMFVNMPQNSGQLAGISQLFNFGDFLVTNFNRTNWGQHKTIVLLSTDESKQLVKTADPANSIFCSLGPDLIGAINDSGLSGFKNEPKDLKEKIEKYLNEKVAPDYEQLLQKGKKDFDAALNTTDLLIKKFFKKYEVTSNDAGAVAEKFEQSPYWEPAVKKFNDIKDVTPPEPDWRIMMFVQTVFSFGQYSKDLPNETGFLAEFKKEVHQIGDKLRTNFGSYSTAGNTLIKEFFSIPGKGLNFTSAKTADASKESSGIWQDTEMAKGKSSAGVDFTDPEKKDKHTGELINYMYYLNIYTLFGENQAERSKIGKCILLTDPKANSAKPADKKPEDKSKKDEPAEDKPKKDEK